MRVALVHDWLVTFGGGELVLAQLLRLFPEARVFTLLDHMAGADRAGLGIPRQVTTSFLQHMPGVASRHRYYLPLYPAAVRSLDVSGYDLVISVSHAAAKNVRIRPGQRHVCYCLSPMRYAWDLRDQYLAQTGLDRGVRGWLAHRLLDRMRAWDLEGTHGVTEFVTLSHFVADRIRRAYGRDSTVVHPPVDTRFFTPGPASAAARDPALYVTAGRLVPYKRIDMIARAFARLPDRRLVIIGTGPELRRVREAAGPNVELLGFLPREELRDHLRRARAFLFAAEEDFGISPLEAQACGAPVIAYARGGALETIRGLDSPEPTGVFFEEQTVDSLVDAVRRFEGRERIAPAACRTNAERFAAERFVSAIRETFDGRTVGG